jgi:hypothetical protein
MKKVGLDAPSATAQKSAFMLYQPPPKSWFSSSDCLKKVGVDVPSATVHKSPSMLHQQPPKKSLCYQRLPENRLPRSISNSPKLIFHAP